MVPAAFYLIRFLKSSLLAVATSLNLRPTNIFQGIQLGKRTAKIFTLYPYKYYNHIIARAVIIPWFTKTLLCIMITGIAAKLVPSWFLCCSKCTVLCFGNKCLSINFLIHIYIKRIVFSRVRCHIVHLSSAQSLTIIRKAKEAGAPLTVETTHHYLSLTSEHIPPGATYYKCCPPVRGYLNKVP